MVPVSGLHFFIPVNSPTLCLLAPQINDLDARLANFRNYRPLSSGAVLAHLVDFGLEEEIAQHNAIRGLSGGQKVKLVLAGGCWRWLGRAGAGGRAWKYVCPCACRTHAPALHDHPTPP